MTGSAPGAGDADVEAISALLTVLRITRVLERIDAGISPQQYRMLKLIGLGGERSARLADKLAVAKPTLTATADSLVAAGLACREAEPGDRRVVRLHLTQAGRAAMQQADAAYAAWFGALLDHTGERHQIVADLLKLDEAMTERRLARLAMQPAESRPAESQPVQSQPAESQLVQSQPAESQPVQSQPAESQPAGSQATNRRHSAGQR